MAAPEKPGPNGNRRLTPAEWEEAVRRVVEDGERQAAVARDMGCSRSGLCNRVKKAREVLQKAKPARAAQPPMMTVTASVSIRFGGLR